MSHFYRLHTVNDVTGAHCGIGVAETVGPEGPWQGLPTAWKREAWDNPIRLVPSWPKCKVLRAPVLPPGCGQVRDLFQLKPGMALPDIWAWRDWALVSERAKKVLQACDGFGHQYLETDVQDVQRQRINRTPYYLLNVRRVLQLDDLEPCGDAEGEEAMFRPLGGEREFLPVVRRTQDLKDRLARLPLWRQFGEWSVIYLSEAVLEALREARITGIDPYTTCDGAPGEALARFE